MTNHDSNYKDPSWWTGDHSSAWERTKEALRRDWEQTKADVSDGGKELNQNASDTVKQAAGKEAIPGGNLANPSRGGWDDAEPGLRFGVGARAYHRQGDWDDKLEGDLRKDWESKHGEGTWERIKAAVRHGWDSAKRAV